MYKQTVIQPVDRRGSSSIAGTEFLVSQLPAFFAKHGIQSIFDAGSNDCAWQIPTLKTFVKYSAGDHNILAVEEAKAICADVDIRQHDVRYDPIPMVDALFMRDVAIHFNNANKSLMIQNWLNSAVPWILMTQNQDAIQNLDFEHQEDEFPFAAINWTRAPWSWPKPVDFVYDLWPNSLTWMALWHRDQISKII